MLTFENIVDLLHSVPFESVERLHGGEEYYFSDGDLVLSAWFVYASGQKTGMEASIKFRGIEIISRVSVIGIVMGPSRYIEGFTGVKLFAVDDHSYMVCRPKNFHINVKPSSTETDSILISLMLKYGYVNVSDSM